MAHEIPELDRKGLRQFGLVTGGIIAILFGLFFPWLLEISIPRWPWVIAALLSVWGLIAPMSLSPVYRSWMKFGLLLSRITTPVILGTVYYLLIFPMGFVMRRFGRDPMTRNLDDKVASYRVASRKAPKSNMERPF